MSDAPILVGILLVLPASLSSSVKQKACRVMMEHADSHERHGFANLEDLCAFLREQADGSVEE